jgi:type IV pilus assembly protein PilO
MAIRTGLEGKPWYWGLGLGLVVGIVLFLLTNQLWLKPLRETRTQKEGQLAELQTKIQEGRSAKAKLPQFREEVRRLELELEKLLRILPARRNTPDLLRRIRTLTEQGDFELLRFTPGNFVDQEFYSEWPIGISLEGTYHNLALFFDRIRRFSRIINVENLGVEAIQSPGSPHTIRAGFTAKTFVYKEPEPEAATSEAAPAAGG